MTEKLKSQIKALAVINAILFLAVLYTALAVMNNLSPPSHEDMLSGKLTYLSSQSDPTNISKGVWIKITLENPKKAKTSDFVIGFDISGVAHAYFNFDDNSTAKYGNYTAQFYDENKDGYVSSGDVFHIYGGILKNATVGFSISGYSGSLRVKI